jgi:hypothetical protein
VALADPDHCAGRVDVLRAAGAAITSAPTGRSDLRFDSRAAIHRYSICLANK